MPDTAAYAIRHAIDPQAAAAMDTSALRERFHIADLFTPGSVNITYTHYDRMVVGGATPSGGELALRPVKSMGTDSFLARRELIVVNIGGSGAVSVGGERHALGQRDMLYAGMGAGEVAFTSDDASAPAKFYLLSAPAMQAHPTRVIRQADARRLDLGSQATSNERSIFQYIHADGVQTCQLVAGMTQLAEGSVWNTMPAHLHDRRMEVYLYFDLADDARVFHLMGQPHETRHIVMQNEEAVLSPPWSIHSGAGTSNYAFIWAMAGDNVDYTDVDPVLIGDLR